MTTDLPTLEALLARVEKATGPDRQLDRAIWRTLGGQVIPITEIGGHTHERWIDGEGVRWKSGDTGITVSIDAALALVEKVLPEVRIDIRGYRWGRGTWKRGEMTAREWAVELEAHKRVEYAKSNLARFSLARSILAALLCALIAQAKEQAA